ncbi:hypothetical protein HOP51_00725 [Halomonas sp. MCCC 1A11036]|uniref:Uncharacterized protein n=1 Tax=Billgrantia zhangzhouensis TaxID=2733481 RepID=A0ABS9ACJ7_9GAMM|nr:hypothetical protein [Halomonas zhangzhouensis]MCE8018643.1 hypothetical protein [Halomonas zhangzhouensis]
MNKLAPVVIHNPTKKSLVYKARDGLMVALTFFLWAGLFFKFYLTIFEGEMLALSMITVTLAKLIVVGFFVTFLIFHCWAIYNRYLYNQSR